MCPENKRTPDRITTMKMWPLLGNFIEVHVVIVADNRTSYVVVYSYSRIMVLCLRSIKHEIWDTADLVVHQTVCAI